MFRCSGVQVFSGVFRCVLVFRCLGVLVFRCVGVLVFRSQSDLLVFESEFHLL